jgi:hypothetical protein
MRDLIELSQSIDKSLTARERRERICDLLIGELQTLKGRDLAPYLSEFVFEMVEPGTKIVLKFPLGAHIFDTEGSDIKSNHNIGID